MTRHMLMAAGTALLCACASTGASSNEVLTEGRTDGLADLTVEMAVEVIAGDVRVVLFNSAEAWSGGSPVMGTAEAAAPLVTLRFEGLESGEYGIKAFHDINGNGVLDTNVLGMPTEPFAFSNNAPANFGPATWEDAAFTVSAPATLHKMEIK